MSLSARFAVWKNDAPFAYTMTYDEGTVDCLANAYPVHEQFGFPGHVNVVAGQLGRQRNSYRSSLNDYVHMSVDELGFLIGHGWGIGNHSWSHFVYPCQPGLDMYREIVWSRYTLEDQLDRPVRIFALCNDAYNYGPMIDLVKDSHLACIANCFPSPNAPDVDLHKIGNMRLSSAPYPPRPSWPEMLTTPRIDLDSMAGRWLLDTTHLCMWEVPQPHKCVTPADLTQRFEKLTEISDGRLWAATPDEVVDYILMRSALTVQPDPKDSTGNRLVIGGPWPVGAVNNDITLLIDGVDPPVNSVVVDAERATVPGAPCGAFSISPQTTTDGGCMVTFPAWPGQRIELQR